MASNNISILCYDKKKKKKILFQYRIKILIIIVEMFIVIRCFFFFVCWLSSLKVCYILFHILKECEKIVTSLSIEKYV